MKKNKITGVIVFIILEIILAFFEKSFFNWNNLIDRVVIFSLINLFISFHFVFDIKKMYNYIFKERYKIGLIIFISFIIMEYNGSSIQYWNGIIQPNNQTTSGTVVFGELRDVRADDFFVTVPTVFSQKFNNFNSVSNKLFGVKNEVFLYPGLPSWHISILGKLSNIGYLFLPLSNAYSFSYFFKLFLIFFASFELCLIITNRNKLYSFVGTMLITFSGASCWWSNMGIIGTGSAAIVFFNKFLETDKKKNKIIYSFLVGLFGANYIMGLYPAWMVPFGYVYLCLVIWLIVKNKKNLYWGMLRYLLIVIFVICIIVIPAFADSYDVYKSVTSTLYPGSRLILGGTDSEKMISYYLNLFFPFKDFFNESEYGCFISLFPIPIVVSLFYLIKNSVKKKNNDLLLLLFSIVAILLSIWNYIKVPKILLKLSLMSFSTPSRSQLAVGYICVLLMIRIMSILEKNTKVNIKKVLAIFLVSFLFNGLCIYYLNSIFDDYYSKKMILVSFVFFSLIVGLFLLNDVKINKLLSLLLIFVSVLVGVTVNPLVKGIGVFYDKPVSHKIQKLNKENKKSRWLVVNSNYAIPNYVLANGAITVNSTNYYPNIKLWKKFDNKTLTNYIYNRYAHVRVNMTNDETSFELLSMDSFLVNLNENDLNKFNVQYILSMEDISDYFHSKVSCIYKEDGIYIYEVG